MNRINSENIDEKISLNEELIESLKENFKIKFGKEFYSFSGSSSAAILIGGEWVSGFTDEEQSAMTITRKLYALRSLKQEKEHMAKLSKVRKYIKKVGIHLSELASLYPDDLKYIREIDSDDYED